ncbi:MAG TPA: biotin/lipoyl-containing protein [Candidatus Dormibacteraeota bacterium]|nr:biotin/lipoyl-containing protein [Candidatus Dormibacteraeota bacterium]
MAEMTAGGPPSSDPSIDGHGQATPGGDGSSASGASSDRSHLDDAPTDPPGLVDPRAIRVSVAASTALPGEEPIVVAPPPDPLAPLPETFAGRGLLGGAGIPRPTGPDARHGRERPVAFLVDGVAGSARLERLGADRARLLEPEGPEGASIARNVVLMPVSVGPDGVSRREVVVDGWRIEVAIEPERRAALRERARRGREATAHGGPTEVRAIIPGRVVAVSVVPGDAVTAGQQILVVEAMKMQNELRAPRDGTVRQVGVAVGRTIEVGDVLLVIE